MSKLIKFPNSYIFVTGYDVYKSFISKYASSLPINGNNISYLKAPEELVCYYPNDIINYYRENMSMYSKEAAKVTLLESPLLNSLVDINFRYYKCKHLTETQFNALYQRLLNTIRESIDMSSVFYIYLKYHPRNSRNDTGILKDSYTIKILSSNSMFNYKSIYSNSTQGRLSRFDKLISYHLENSSKRSKFNEIIDKKEAINYDTTTDDDSGSISASSTAI